MTTNKLLLLQEEMTDFQGAASRLRYSLEHTRTLLPGDGWNPDHLERLEARACRFSRLSAMLTQRIMRLIDDLELAPANSLLDCIAVENKR